MKSFFTSSKLRALSVLAIHLRLLTPSQAILDVNTNGMSDLWEKQHNNGDLFPNTFLGADDPDQDGWSNATEATAGTDPHWANPPDGIIAITLEPTTTAGAYSLTWPTIIGKNYRLQASYNLINWINVGDTFIGTATSHTSGISAVQPDTTIPPKLFWRVVASDLDTDTDGLTNAEEVRLGLDPANAMNIPGIPDLWLATHFFNELLTVGLTAVVANPDADGDGRTIQQENADGTDPNKADTDEDGLNDSIDADPLDAIVNWQTIGRPNFAVIEISITNVADLTYCDHSANGTILLGRPVATAQPTAVIIDKQQNVDEIPWSAGNGAPEGIWLTHLHDDLVPSLKNTGNMPDSLYEPITNTYQAWECPTNYQDMICDVRDGLVIGTNWLIDPGFDDLLRLSPQGEALPEQTSPSDTRFAYIDKDANITCATQYWAKQPDGSYLAKQYPSTPDLIQNSVSCATHSQIVAGVEKKWNLVTRSGAPSLLISENGGDFHRATKRFGSKNLRAVTRQGWIFDDQFNVWTGQQWQTLLEILGSDYTQAELLGINDEGLAVAKIKKPNQPMKIGLLVPFELKKCWETSNYANQIFNKTKKDDSAGDSTILEMEGDATYAVPRNKLYVVAGSTDNTLKLSLDVSLPETFRERFVAAAFDAGNKVQNSDKLFPANPGLPADMEIPIAGNNVKDYEIKLAYDANNNGILDDSEVNRIYVYKRMSNNELRYLTVKGISNAKYEEHKEIILDKIHLRVLPGGIPNPFPQAQPSLVAKHARSFLALFYYNGEMSNIDTSLRPTSNDTAVLDAFSTGQGFAEWLTHNSGASFSDAGVAEIQNYTWEDTSSISQFFANRTPFALESTLVNQQGYMELPTATGSELKNFYDNNVKAAADAALQNSEIGATVTFPQDGGWYEFPRAEKPNLFKSSSPQTNPNWVTPATIDVGKNDGYNGLGALVSDIIAGSSEFEDFDAFGVVGRGRVISPRYRITIKKEQTGIWPFQSIKYNVSQVRFLGEIQDLYDFNYDDGELPSHAAAMQIGYGKGANGSYSSRGLIYRHRIVINHIYNYPFDHTFIPNFNP